MEVTRLLKVKGVSIALYGKLISELWSVTCHMRSHSVTCHLTGECTTP